MYRPENAVKNCPLAAAGATSNGIKYSKYICWLCGAAKSGLPGFVTCSKYSIQRQA